MSCFRHSVAPCRRGGVALVVTGVSGLSAAHARGRGGGQAGFPAQCAICHADKAGVNKIGPSLFGVVGRHTGSRSRVFLFGGEQERQPDLDARGAG